MTIVEWATAGLELANEKGKTVDDLIVYLKNAEGISRLFDKLFLQPESKTDTGVWPVVLCRDCKYSEPYGLDLKCCKHSGGTKNKLGEDLEYIERHSKYFYCADGKRKDEQE